MTDEYSSVLISTNEAKNLAREHYGIDGTAKALPGELDLNFMISGSGKRYILKISRPGADLESINYQVKILEFLQGKAPITPLIIPDINGGTSFEISDKQGRVRNVRLLSWIDGRLWSQVKPHSTGLLESLGQKAGELTTVLKDFDHDLAHREFDWDIAQLGWTRKHLDLFDHEEKKIVSWFLKQFEDDIDGYAALPKSVVHNDANDNNVVVDENLQDPAVKAIIDFGDTIFTQTINDLAITIAYAAMDKPDPLDAAMAVIRGYSKSYLPDDSELKHLYVLIAARLIISVTKSAINKRAEPENDYLLISEKPAWALLRKWYTIDANHAYYSFRLACGMSPHPDHEQFVSLAKGFNFSIQELIPTAPAKEVIAPELGVGSPWVGTMAEQEDIDELTHKFKKIQVSNPEATIAGGYGEIRSIYSTEAYKVETNNGPQYRTVHLGLDFWFPADTAISSLFNGRVFALVNNDKPKDYGVTLILEHEVDGIHFYTLYGHLGRRTLDLFKPGDSVQKGEPIGFLGDVHENGGWSPHLHFQVMLNRLGNTTDFPGVATYPERDLWLGICPDPGLLFKENIPLPANEEADLTAFRQAHLGKGMSLSYDTPLTILRGHGVWLIDHTGRKYLDTVNNVAHLGHEHPDVVRAGQEQMAVLNTNTRYLNKNINEFAESLLATLPSELAVVHLVNSGSEANELALRMAKTATGSQDMIAMEVGYHGNTSGCIAVSSYKFDGSGGSGCPPHTHLVPLPDQYRGRYQGKDTGEKYAAHVQELIDKVAQNGRSIAGFICESIISCGGQIELPPGFLQKAYAAVRAAGGICIADEVQVGCGRVGATFWGFELHGVVPDIVTIGKPIGNGHPLAAVVSTREVADAFANGMEYFNTFGGNPVSSIIGKTVLKVIEHEKLQENALDVGNYLKQKLHEMQGSYPIIGDVRGQGLFLGFELNGSDKTPLPDKASYLTNRMKELGVLMSLDGPDHNVLKIKPPMVFSKINADELLKRLEQVFAEDYMRS